MATLLPPKNLLIHLPPEGGAPSSIEAPLDEQQEPLDEQQEATIKLGKKKKLPLLLASPPESLGALRSAQDLHLYNLETLKKIARMGAVTLPKNAPRAACLRCLELALFGQQKREVEEDEDVHTVTISCQL